MGVKIGVGGFICLETSVKESEVECAQELRGKRGGGAFFTSLLERVRVQKRIGGCPTGDETKYLGGRIPERKLLANGLFSRNADRYTEAWLVKIIYRNFGENRLKGKKTAGGPVLFITKRIKENVKAAREAGL